MKKKIVWLILSCLMALSLVIASCGPAVTEEEEEVVTEEEEVVTEEEEVVAEEEVAEGMVLNTAGRMVERPRYGGYYHLRRQTDLRGFDDVLPSSPAYHTANLNLTHDELYTGDWAKGPQGTEDASFTIGSSYLLHLETPSLATSFELPDNETIIWHIRQGVHFLNKPPVNGREYNAHDAAFNLSRSYLTPGSYLYNTYRQDRGEGPISIVALDDWTVEMKVPPARQVPILFASNDYVYHHAPEVIEQYGDASLVEAQIGTGAFIMTDYIPVSSIFFERNPNYWMHNPLHPEDQLPYVDGVKIYIIPDLVTSQAAFRVGKLESSSFEKEDWEALVLTTPELLWRRLEPAGSYAIFMRQDKPELPYDDIRVRKALFYAINHQDIIDYYYEGEAVMISSPVCGRAEFKDMYTSFEELSEETQKLYGYYPEEAIELLAEAGYPDGFEATILTSIEDKIPIIVDAWAKIGVTLNIDLRTSAVVSGITRKMQQEDMYYGGAQGSVVLKVNNWRTDSYFNHSMVDDERFNAWFEEFNLSMLDWTKLSEMYREMTPYLKEQAYFIDLPAGYSYYMWWPWLKGWRGETSVGYFNSYGQIAYLWIDKDLREEMVGIER